MNMLKERLDTRPDLQKYLFCRGFLITDQTIDTTGYPFYMNWECYQLQGYTAYVHHQQKVTVYQHENLSLILIGHAYNPYTMETDEKEESELTCMHFIFYLWKFQNIRKT